MSCAKWIPNPAYPNVILMTDPQSIDWSGIGGNVRLQFKIHDRITKYGALNDAFAAIPLVTDPTADYLLEVTNGAGWSPAITDAQMPIYWRKRIRVEENVTKGGNSWIATADYAGICSPDDERVSYTTTGYTEIIRVPLETRVSTEVNSFTDLEILEAAGTLQPDGTEADNPPEPGGINVGEDGEVLGCERYVPELRLALQKCFAPGFLSQCTAINELYQVDGSVNETTWRCFGPREIQLQGFDAQSTAMDPALPASQQNLEPDILTIYFLARPSIWLPMGLTFNDEAEADGLTFSNPDTGQTIGTPPDQKTVYQKHVRKAGFDKLDIRFEKTIQEVVADNFREIMQPRFAYVHRVDNLVDFNSLSMLS